MKIGLITTLDTNIGDDFIREGICHVLEEVFKGQQLEFVSVNKHKPYTVYPAWHPIHLRHIDDRIPVGQNLFRQFADHLFSKMGYSRFDNCDLIVQSGAPVFWPNCNANEWAKPLWHDIIGRLHEKIPVINLAAGSCYPWERQPSAIELPEDEKYIQAILGYCRLTTVRDHLSRTLCKTLGWETPLIPCSAFLAAKGRKAQISDSSYILINYMTGGGHYSWEQGIDNAKWEETVKTLIFRLGKRHRLAMLCHGEQEFSLAKLIAPHLPVFYPKTLKEYFDCISEAKFAICNRMHASVAMAGIGVPSIAICTDTRLLMVSEIGLKTYYVKDAHTDVLEDAVEKAGLSRKAEQNRLLLLQAETWENYISVIKAALANI
jgi:hypothetical protein